MSDKNDIAISVKNVSKTFKLPHERQKSLKGSFLNFFQRKDYERQEALKDVSFDVKKGEFFGIVGRNGSGKSTLLKTIAGIYVPDSGSIQINGTLTPFIELGVGFNPELTGRENVFLNGALLGFSRKQMESMYKDIVEFAELERFMDQKLKNYSSGMQVRLAFSIAIRAESSILLLDEVLAVGDAAFQQKCNDYFARLKGSKRTILLVSHNMSSIEQYCDRALLLEDNKIAKIGSSEDVAGGYEDMILKQEAAKGIKSIHKDALKTYGDGIGVNAFVVQNSKPTHTVEALKNFKIILKIISKKDIPEAYIGINIKNSQNDIIFAIDTRDYVGAIEVKGSKEKQIEINIDNVYTNGTYRVGVAVAGMINDSKRVLFRARNICSFTIFGIHKNSESLVHPKFSINEGKIK